jgi:broad specificity phosphatase PhoE
MSALRIVLIRPGSTDFDEQGRIKGTLDIPMNARGATQATRAADELGGTPIELIYTSPGQSAIQTAETLAASLKVKYKVLDKLQNLDHGLWHGKLIEEVRRRQPKVYRRWQEQPESVCPPEGETLASAQTRIRNTMKRLLKKHKRGVIALVVPDPLASILRCCVERSELGNMWKAECDFGGWELLELTSAEALSV